MDFVENLEQKEQAFEEGLKRVTECQKILGNTATINLVAGNQEEPVVSVSIFGYFDVSKMPSIYKILKAPYVASHE
jgi:hypothetical protein